MENSKKASLKSLKVSSKSKSIKANSKSKSKTVVLSSSKSGNKPLSENVFMRLPSALPMEEQGRLMKLHREHDELDESYRQRIEFVKKIVAEKKVQLTAKMVPFVSTMSFVHVYKKSGMYGYPKEVETAYQKLV